MTVTWPEVQHPVTLSAGFWIAEVPCTQALWRAVTGASPSHFEGDRRPVEQVSWNDVQAFIDSANRSDPSLQLRLPTEAEWEFACRAGTTEATYAGPLQLDDQGRSVHLDGVAWYSEKCVR